MVIKKNYIKKMVKFNKLSSKKEQENIEKEF